MICVWSRLCICSRVLLLSGLTVCSALSSFMSLLFGVISCFICWGGVLRSVVCACHRLYGALGRSALQSDSRFDFVVLWSFLFSWLSLSASSGVGVCALLRRVVCLTSFAVGSFRSRVCSLARRVCVRSSSPCVSVPPSVRFAGLCLVVFCSSVCSIRFFRSGVLSSIPGRGVWGRCTVILVRFYVNPPIFSLCWFVARRARCCFLCCRSVGLRRDSG